jgi:hypothetical protein
LILYKVLQSILKRINFTTKEPFGELLFSKLSNTGSGENYDDASTYNPKPKYVYRNMYRNTQSGALQDIDKNKLRGSINRQAVTEYPLEHLTYQEVLLCYCGRKNSGRN